MPSDDVHQQYKTTDLLRIRVETHERYSEAPLDLDAACVAVLELAGDEALLDVGCGPGVFLRYLRGHGHRGRLAGLDQSEAMVAEATRAARGAGAAIEWFTGLADALPFADGEFALLSARHMLYHVPDIPAALAEFARVVGPGGVVLATTNGAHSTPGLTELTDGIAQRFGLRAAPGPSLRFNTDNAPEQLREVFRTVEETIRPGALVFTDPGPIVRYVMTQSVPQRAADDPELFERVHAWATVEATRRLEALGGTWRDPKSVGLYRCVAPVFDSGSSRSSLGSGRLLAATPTTSPPRSAIAHFAGRTSFTQYLGGSASYSCTVLRKASGEARTPLHITSRRTDASPLAAVPMKPLTGARAGRQRRPRTWRRTRRLRWSGPRGGTTRPPS